MCTTFSLLFFNITFDSINPSHVHTYISRWGPEEQSPSLEINFDSTNLMHLYPAHSARRGIHSMKEVETSEPTQSLSLLPLPCSWHSYTLLTWLSPKGSHCVLNHATLAQVITVSACICLILCTAVFIMVTLLVYASCNKIGLYQPSPLHCNVMCCEKFNGWECRNRDKQTARIQPCDTLGISL